MGARITGIACALLLLAGAAEAAESKKRVGTLSVVHADSAVLNTSNGGEGSVPLAETMPFTMRPNEELTILVADPNPLLYEYKWKGIVLTKTADYQAAVQFAEALGPLLGILGTGVPGKDTRDFIRPPDLEKSSRDFQAAVARMRKEGKIGPNLEAQLEEVNRRIDELKDYVDRLTGDAEAMRAASEHADKVLATRGINTEFFTRMAARFAALKTNGDAIPSLIEESAGRGGPASVKAKVAEWRVAELAKAIGEDYRAIADVQRDLFLDRELRLWPPNVTLARLLLARDLEAGVRESLAALKRFADVAATINEPVTLGTVPFDRANRQDASFEITVVSANATAASKSSRKTGKFVFSIEPHSALRVGFGPAFVYSFVRSPQFSAEKSGDGFIIRQKEAGDYTGRNIAAMLTLTPTTWVDNPYAPVFQIGASSENKAAAFFFGAGLVAYDLLHIGGGVTLQQVPRLVSGLAAGQLIATADDLKTENRFKVGPYLQVTVSLKK